MQIATRTIVGRRQGPHLLIVGGIHGDEFEPMMACRRLLREIAPEQLSGRITVAPCVNESAFARCLRTADDGKDLARTCPGRADGTLTEQVAFAVSEWIRSADFLIDMHTAGARYGLLPLAGYTLHPDTEVLAQQRRMARAFNLPIVWGTNPRFNGTTLAVARDAKIPAIYVENGGGSTYELKRVEENVRGCRAVARVLGMLDEPAAADQVRYFVEDDRDHSGHLQRQHPAPVAGFFEPCVVLGDIVQAGQTIGRMIDTLGDQVTEIKSEREGTVLFLRVFPSVQQGDALMSLLPITAPGEIVIPHDPT